ncbi:MAG: hypothetical protein C4531_06145 [Desulfurivibrio sp.]|jgi:hypothetical protein|nr:MAG: hypothetical protein C4531_06145 [Desulfurivibrio sp.]
MATSFVVAIHYAKYQKLLQLNTSGPGLFSSATGEGVFAASVVLATSPISPLDPSVKEAVGWAYAAYGLFKAYKSWEAEDAKKVLIKNTDDSNVFIRVEKLGNRKTVLVADLERGDFSFDCWPSSGWSEAASQQEAWRLTQEQASRLWNTMIHDKTWPILGGTVAAASGAGLAFGGGGAALTVINWGPRAAGFLTWAGSGQGQNVIKFIGDFIWDYAGDGRPGKTRFFEKIVTGEPLTTP